MLAGVRALDLRVGFVGDGDDGRGVHDRLAIVHDKYRTKTSLRRALQDVKSFVTDHDRCVGQENSWICENSAGRGAWWWGGTLPRNQYTWECEANGGSSKQLPCVNMPSVWPCSLRRSLQLFITESMFYASQSQGR